MAEFAKVFDFLIKVLETVHFAVLLQSHACLVVAEAEGQSRPHGQIVCDLAGCARMVEHIWLLLLLHRRLRLSTKLEHNFHQLFIRRQRLICYLVVLKAALRTLAALWPGYFELA